MNHRHAKAFATVAMSFLLLAATACKSAGNSAAPVQTYSKIDPATAGSIEGVIHFDSLAPKRVEIDMAQDPACAMTGGTNLSEQTMVTDGKLANVYISISSGLGDKVYAPSSTPVVLDQKGCRYIPHVIAAQAGQPIEFRNSDPTMHNIHMEPQVAGNHAVDISQGPANGSQSPTTRYVFAKPETMIPVRCNNHPWMQAYINIAPSPFYAISDASGHYAIAGLPPGVYTLTAIHEQLGVQQATVTVTSHGVAQADFHYGVAAAK